MYAFIADLHIGAPRLSNLVYLQSLDKFLDIIKSHKEECHCIFVCGDLFDHKLNIDEAKFASLFLINLVCNNCGRTRTHVPVYFIHGTYSHDYEQYGIFMPMLEKIDNVEVFYTKETCISTLHNGVRVLCLPQIYGDFDYTPYLDNDETYDIIVGHGPMSSTTKSPCKSTDYEILHSADKLGSVSKICVFGHYHGYTDFGNNVYYSGPWLRFQYGEPEPRKFFICDDNYKVELYDSPYAVEYKTITVNTPDELRDIISQGITTPYRFIIKSNKENLEAYHSIMTINKKNENLKYNIMTEEIETKSLDEVTEELNKSNDNNTSLDPVESLISYISDKYNIDTTEQINEYNKKITKEDIK